MSLPPFHEQIPLSIDSEREDAFAEGAWAAAKLARLEAEMAGDSAAP